MPVCLETMEEDAAANAAVLNQERQRTVMQVTWSLVAGGAEMYAFTIASNLDPERFRSVICAVDQGGALEPEVRQSGITLTVMNRRQGIDWRLMWRLFKLFRENKVSIVQTHHFNQLFYSAIAAKLCRADIVHTEHSVELYKQRRYRIALRLLSYLCRSVIAIGSDGARVLTDEVGIPRRKMHIVRAGVDVKEFNQSRQSAREALGLGKSDKVVSIIARLYPEKNHLLLLRAFKEVLRKSAVRNPQAEPLPVTADVESIRDARGSAFCQGGEARDGLPYRALDDSQKYRLLIVGEGKERQRIADEVRRLGLEDSVQMLGVRRDVATILAASDVFVLSSDREGLPIAVLEAMAARCPVVATDVGDLPSVIVDGVTGRLVQPGGAAGLAVAISDLLNDPALASDISARAFEIVDRDYSLRAMIDKHDRIFD